MTKPNLTQAWLSNNALKLIGICAGLIGFFYLVQYRVDAIERRVAEYPSVDYFELKFRTIDEKLVQLENQLADHKEATE